MTQPKMYQPMIDTIGTMALPDLIVAYKETTSAFDELLSLMKDNVKTIASSKKAQELSLENLNGLNEVLEAINSRLSELKTKDFGG